MCQVEWFQEVIPLLSEASIKVLNALLAGPTSGNLHPSRSRTPCRQGITPGGNPVLLSRIPLRELQRASHLSRRSIQRGLALLEEMGLLQARRSTDRYGATTYVIPMELPGLPRQKLRPPGVSKVAPCPDTEGARSPIRGVKSIPLNNHGGDGDEGIIVPISLSTPTTEGVVKGSDKSSPGVKSIPLGLETQLTEIGELHPQELVAKYGTGRVMAALCFLKSKPKRQFTNPPGWLRYQLESGAEFPESVLEAPQHWSWDADPEASKYLWGKYGHIVRH